MFIPAAEVLALLARECWHSLFPSANISPAFGFVNSLRPEPFQNSQIVQKRSDGEKAIYFL